MMRYITFDPSLVFCETSTDSREMATMQEAKWSIEQIHLRGLRVDGAAVQVLEDRLSARVRLFLLGKHTRYQSPDVARGALECARAIREGRFDPKAVRRALWSLDLTKEPTAASERRAILVAMKNEGVLLDLLGKLAEVNREFAEKANTARALLLQMGRTPRLHPDVKLFGMAEDPSLLLGKDGGGERVEELRKNQERYKALRQVSKAEPSLVIGTPESINGYHEQVLERLAAAPRNFPFREAAERRAILVAIAQGKVIPESLDAARSRDAHSSRGYVSAEILGTGSQLSGEFDLGDRVDGRLGKVVNKEFVFRNASDATRAFRGSSKTQAFGVHPMTEEPSLVIGTPESINGYHEQVLKRLERLVVAPRNFTFREAVPVGVGKTRLSLRVPMAVPGCRVAVWYVEPSQRLHVVEMYKKAMAEGAALPSIACGDFGHVVPGAPVLHVLLPASLIRPDGAQAIARLDPDVVILDDHDFPMGSTRRHRVVNYAVGRYAVPRVVVWE